MSAQMNFTEPNGAPLILAPAPPHPLQLLQIALEKGVGVTELATLCERHEDRLARQTFQEAKLMFIRNVPTILKTAHVHIKLKDPDKPPIDFDHAELDKICELVTPALLAVGITARWEQGPRASDSGLLSTRCILTCAIGGHCEDSGWFYAFPDETGGKNKVQAVGSTATYLQRYSLLGVCGIVPKGTPDTDGRVPMGATEKAEYDELQERLKYFANCEDFAQLEEHWRVSRKWAKENGGQKAVDAIDSMKNMRKADLMKASKAGSR